MSDQPNPVEFLSIPTHYASDDDLTRSPVQPALDTLFSEFARRHRSLSPSTQSSPQSSRAHIRPTQPPVPKPTMLDLRTLEYASDYDSHLMCPICHVPFIDPVVLDCDHTFCASCLSEYRRGGDNSERSHCPSCRSYVLSSPRKASRLIYNMCNDIKVRCPNENCMVIIARGSLEHHILRQCPEQKVACADINCERQTKRKNHVHGQCIHDTRIECDCGAVIELGRGEWLKHKDQDCPNTCLRCEKCGQRTSSQSTSQEHVCSPNTKEEQCLGAEFGCTEEVSPEKLSNHISDCIFARLAPHFKTQTRLLQTLQDQLTSSKHRNQNLEMELDRMHNILSTQFQPRLDQVATSTDSDLLVDHETDIEEIPRDTIPSAAAIHHRDLLLPAHIRDLTPSPDFFHHDVSATTTNHPHAHMHNHLLSLHESLRHTVSNLESDMNGLHHAITELDARASMQLMNETLRIKEDLAYANAALVSHRSQIQWLLNRERMGREQAILRERGRVQGIQGNVAGGRGEMERQNSKVTSSIAGSSSAAHQHQHPGQAESFPFPSPGVGMTRTVSGSGTGSASSSAATSPMFPVSGVVGSRRPSMRGGSQERVKL